jgi:hypothetical protein
MIFSSLCRLFFIRRSPFQNWRTLIMAGRDFGGHVTFTANTLQITRISPASGLSGTQVTITGSGFGAAQGSGSVMIGGAASQIASWSDTQIVAAVAPPLSPASFASSRTARGATPNLSPFSAA